jgi:hypothetical protein
LDWSNRLKVVKIRVVLFILVTVPWRPADSCQRPVTPSGDGLILAEVKICILIFTWANMGVKFFIGVFGKADA